MAEKRSSARAACALVRNLILATLSYAALFTIFYVYQHGIGAPNRLLHGQPGELPSDRIDLPTTRTDAPPSTINLEKINPHANWFNRPASLAKIKYDYMGARPDIDTVANLTMLVEACRGTYYGLEKMNQIDYCMNYLDKNESDYFYIPSERASTQPPKDAEYTNADGNSNTLEHYPKQKPHTKSSIGQCHGPIIPYHVYWTGPATWRVELFIKSYLYTQNLPCSRLLIWLDSDKHPAAVESMMTHDPVFAPFLPFVTRGDISLHAWRFPSRIPIPSFDPTEQNGYWLTPGPVKPDGERDIGDGMVRDREGQEWLVLTQKQMTFLPVAVSDAVRFVVLHLYGGSYFDMDVLLLRDMRPLLLGPDHDFAERWAAHNSPGDYNTAVMSLTANSSISSYLLRGGVRMGLNFHPRVVGKMAVKDGRDREWKMLESAVFDPIWPGFNGHSYGGCTVPCFRDYSKMFKGGRADFVPNEEWSGFQGEKVPLIGAENAGEMQMRSRVRAEAKTPTEGIGSVTKFDKDWLAKQEYRIEEDNYPPTNRTLEHFFRGGWSYHIHNQWLRQPQPSSWFAVVQHAHNVFFKGKETNMYGERWTGPEMGDYMIGWEFT